MIDKDAPLRLAKCVPVRALPTICYQRVAIALCRSLCSKLEEAPRAFSAHAQQSWLLNRHQGAQ